jgi:hypothetical protein
MLKAQAERSDPSDPRYYQGLATAALLGLSFKRQDKILGTQSFVVT